MNLTHPLGTSSAAVSNSNSVVVEPFDAGEVLSRTFHGDRTEKTNVRFEQPWHRLAATLLASGKSQKETALLCEVSTGSVRKLFGTPWFQKMVIELMEANGQNDLMALFKAEVLNSHITLVELRDNPQVSPTVRASIATGFIERIYGKATQRIETSPTANISDPLAEEQRLREENERLRAVTGGATGN